jgi:sec-independent protein translocase protein TatB
MREAKFARSLQSQRAEEKPAAPAKRAPAIVQEVVPAPASDELAPAVPAKKPAAKKPKAAAKPPAKKKAEKAAKKTAKKKAG